MPIVHDLLCADSRGVLTYARQHPPGLGRRELSLRLITGLHQYASLDWSETGDVFDRVAQMRPTPGDGDTTRIATLTAKVRPLLAIAVTTELPLFASGGPVAHAAPLLVAFIQAGQQCFRTPSRLLPVEVRGSLASRSPSPSSLQIRLSRVSWRW